MAGYFARRNRPDYELADARILNKVLRGPWGVSKLQDGINKLLQDSCQIDFIIRNLQYSIYLQFTILPKCLFFLQGKFPNLKWLVIYNSLAFQTYSLSNIHKYSISALTFLIFLCNFQIQYNIQYVLNLQ